MDTWSPAAHRIAKRMELDSVFIFSQMVISEWDRSGWSESLVLKFYF